MTTKPEREMTRAEWQALQLDDDGDGPTWGEFIEALTPETRDALTDHRPRDEWGFLMQIATAEPATDAPQYVTLRQVATYLKRNKEQVRRDLNNAPDAPQPAVEGRNGQRYEWLWAELRPWLERKYGRKLPERVWG